MTLQEEYIEAVKSVKVRVEGDYKDHAEETYCACLDYADSGRASKAFREWIADAPDGVSCPRAWLNYGFRDES